MYSKLYKDPHVLSAFLYSNNWSEEVVSRDCLVWFAPLLCLLGVGEVIVSAIVINNSYGYFVGALYTGILSIITSIGTMSLKTRFTVYIYLVFITITYVLSVIGSILSIMNVLFLGRVEACASTVGTSSESCGYTSPLQCYGDSTYFAQAAICASEYDNSHSTSHNHCSCVIHGDSKDCLYFQAFNNCSNLVHHPALYIPTIIAASFALALTVISGYAMFLAYVLLYAPESINKWCFWVAGTIRSPLTIAERMDLEPTNGRGNELRPMHMI